MKTLSIVGCGAIASSLAPALIATGHLALLDILNSSMDSSLRAVRRLGHGTAVASADALRPVDVLLLGCPDRLIAPLARELSGSPVARPGTIAFHLSGVLSAAVLRPLEDVGCLTASVHPLVSVPSIDRPPRTLSGVWCGVDGNEEAIRTLDPILRSAGLMPLRIDGTKKALYHAACVVSCNYFVALQEAAIRLFEEAGIDRSTALSLLRPSLSVILENILQSGRGEALSGPVARGDVITIERHLVALGDDEQMRTLYVALARESLNLVRSSSRWTERHDTLASLLSGDTAPGSSTAPE